MVGRRKTTSPLPPRLYEYRGKRRITYYTITAANKYITLGHDLLPAKRKLLEIEEGGSIAGTIGELLDDYLEAVQAKVAAGKKSPRTYQDNLNEANNLKKAFGRMQPTTLRPVHVWQYLHKARGRAAPVRANREIALLSAAFNFARQAGIVDTNPCVGVERNEEIPRDRYVTENEYAAFLEFASADGEAGKRVALAMQLAYLTGKAQAQVLKLTLTQITDEGILFGARKGGARTLVQWTSALRACVDGCKALPRQVTSIYLLTNRHGQPYTRSGFKTMFQRLQLEWKNAGHERFTFHDLRAKATTDLIEQGRKASELTGHRTEDMPAKVYDRRAIRKAPAAK